MPGEENRTEYLPRGVAAVIAPWNFPLAILTGMTTAALGHRQHRGDEAGRAVARDRRQADGDFQRRCGCRRACSIICRARAKSVGAALVEHPDVALIAFTGSRAVGLAINRRAAEISATAAGIRQVKRVIVEMGGKNAIIVDDDADLDEAVAGVVQARSAIRGKNARPARACIVLAAVYDAFLSRLVEAARSLKVGPAEDPVVDASAR